MSGFLNNLVERSAGTASVLSRRRPAIFESHLRAPVLRDDRSQEGGLSEIHEQIPGPPAPERRHPLQADRQPEVQPVERKVRPAMDQLTLRPVNDPTVAAVFNAIPGPEPTRRIAGVRTSEPPPRNLHRERTTVVEKRIETIKARDAVPAQTLSLPRVQLNAVARQKSVEPALPAPNRIPLAPPDRPVAGIAVQIARASAASRESAATDIQVSIGRVEIKATQEPAKSARRGGPATPKLTLDDYLSSRRAGKP